MNKLIEQLNEYEPYIQSDGTYTDNFWWYVSQGHSAVFPKEVGVDRIISRSYGFIKWLVANDKISYKRIEWSELWKTLHKLYGDTDGPINYYPLIMLLSIQQEPLGLLNSMIK